MSPLSNTTVALDPQTILDEILSHDSLNVFDQLIDELGGPDKVSEISNRRGRVIQKDNGQESTLLSLKKVEHLIINSFFFRSNMNIALMQTFLRR
jgi:hypothetical protein